MARDQAGRFVSSLEAMIAKAVVDLTLRVDANLRRAPDAGGTPVDTGHARANWVPSVGAPFDAETAGEGAHAAGVAAVLSYKPGQGSLFVSNNAPYIGRLNLGGSQQAPAGFIEAAIDEALASVQGKYDGVTLEVGGLSQFGDAAGGRAAAGMADAYSPFGGDE